jgi:hypothetical protein
VVINGSIPAPPFHALAFPRPSPARIRSRMLYHCSIATSLYTIVCFCGMAFFFFLLGDWKKNFDLISNLGSVRDILYDIYSFGNPVSCGNAANSKECKLMLHPPLFYSGHLVLKVQISIWAPTPFNIH